MLKVVLILTLVSVCMTLPFKEMIALVNSLEVGRDEDPNTWSCTGCDESNKPNNVYIIQEKDKAVRSSLAIYDEFTVLAFRYTANVQNVLQDVVYINQKQDQNAPSGCKVQSAYDNMWGIIREDVMYGLSQHVKTKTLVITGISLGGGLACLSYVDIKASGLYNKVQIVTYGAPRVGNDKWAAWFNSITTSTRIYINADPIPTLPTCLLLCNYAQTGTSTYVCNTDTEICTLKVNSKQETKGQNVRMITKFIREAKKHKNELINGDFGGILDHIYGYKEVSRYTLVD